MKLKEGNYPLTEKLHHEDTYLTAQQCVDL